ncbi:hypothetical protein [Solirubrum puertoriconensis]|uniref:Uncharacterized protein n=1 Tax=Solirubrum puertoriconensis TaxID=1751427 RepID=A0A9X0HL86_SOLP1|nr:hypothetical protein [Solirubrum puertoriconensis]KUG07974.1 hypothetical protein ASU33_07125 [Solirubrum puertoriconensis]
MASFTVSGTGYVGIRFKNNAGATIRNLAISFAIEQWCNSGLGGVLPVELVAFKAERLGADVRCAWQTATEKNNRQFVVERSIDG